MRKDATGQPVFLSDSTLYNISRSKLLEYIHDMEKENERLNEDWKEVVAKCYDLYIKNQHLEEEVYTLKMQLGGWY